MPNPVPLATKEEEERRAWVTAHHEVVRLIKDCFGDRFSNNEIFDRLKISRRTGYRALGNDDRIGKAPGRKPKISDDTIRSMIEYIETGGCNDVGNVWKHLAEKFASDCNPKTVQDAVKKSGFKNYRTTVKLEPLLNEEIPDNQPTPDEENARLQQQQQQQQSQQHQQGPEPKNPYLMQQHDAQQSPQQPIPQPQQQQHPHQSQQQPPHPHTPHQQPMPQQHAVIDPSFQQYDILEILRQAIEASPEGHIRYILWEICTRIPDAQRYTASTLIPHVAAAASAPLPQMGPTQMPRLDTSLHGASLNSADPGSGKRPRLAICRRCNQQYDRAENTMENRSCLYHKGSPQKISPDEVGTIEESPEAFIWSCCGGNGRVRGCCRAMHTTKKKRKYGKKRDATEAGLDADDETGPDESTVIDVEDSLESPQPLSNPNIDTTLQDLQPAGLSNHVTMQMFSSELPSSFLQQSQLQDGDDSGDTPQNGISSSPRMQSNGQISQDIQAQLQLTPASGQA